MCCYWYGINTTLLAHRNCQEQISILLNKTLLKGGYDPYSPRKVQLLVSCLVTYALFTKHYWLCFLQSFSEGVHWGVHCNLWWKTTRVEWGRVIEPCGHKHYPCGRQTLAGWAGSSKCPTPFCILPSQLAWSQKVDFNPCLSLCFPENVFCLDKSCMILVTTRSWQGISLISFISSPAYV